MKRGEVWSAAGGPDYARKPRPVVIVQDDSFSETASITVCALTTTDIGPAEFRPPIEPDASNGLRHPSWAMADKITTLPRGKLRERLGRLSPADMGQLNRAMMVFLGLARLPRG
ncbi:MAG: type II toxin-antitoxin system PemK/MazF family toxin [Alphaproteobacteria bacterium]|nr:MAG: type II toxin-antitoxin system PemK/MazF family toxin [Alphaproteobacteria bacterium]